MSICSQIFTVLAMLLVWRYFGSEEANIWESSGESSAKLHLALILAFGL